MPPEEVEQFEAVARELLDELGYKWGVDRLAPEVLGYVRRLREVRGASAPCPLRAAAVG